MPSTNLPALQLPDPNGFTNALAAGMKMRQVQNESERLARKDELAVRKSNALSEFGQSDRGPEAVRKLYRDAPDAAPAAEKNTRDAQLADIQAKKYQIEWSKANHQLLVDASGAMAANPTRENVTMILDSLEAQGGDMSRPRQQLASAPDDKAILGYIKGWAGTAMQVQKMALDEQKANEPPKSQWDSYNGQWVTPPSTGAGSEAASTVAPPGAPGRRPAMVPGGTSGFTTDRIKAEIDRLDQGQPLSPEFAGISSREGLVTLLQAQTDLETAQGGAQAQSPAVSTPPPPPADGQPTTLGGPQAPVDGQQTPVQPTPVDSPQAPVVPVYHSRAEREAARDAVSDARYKDEQARKAPKTITKGGVTYEYADGRWIPAQGVVTTPADPPRAVSQADAKWLKDQDESGAAAEKLSSTIEQARSVIAAPAGVLGNSPMDQAAYKLHEWGLNNSDTSVNTERLRELGAQMTLSFGSLGAQVSNADREVYARAQGNFERAKSPEAMKLSLDQMSAVSERVIEKINRNRTTYQQTGRKPDFAPAPPAGQATPQSDPPLPKPVKVAPLEDLDSMPMPGKYAGKFLTTPEGLRYRSDGSRWVRQ